MVLQEVVLVLGGSRSGKSAWAEQIAGQTNQQVVYLATAGIKDQEMAQRVKIHRQRRPHHWQTMEETHDLKNALHSISSGTVVLVDCLTMWVTNILLDDNIPQPQADDIQKEHYLLEHIEQTVALARQKQHTLILVSNEVGWGLVPDNALGRLFRDVAGKINQQVAQLADRVFLVVAGLSQELKTPATPREKGDL